MDKIFEFKRRPMVDKELLEKDAEVIARSFGINDSNKIDAYRHAYTIARLSAERGRNVAHAVGSLNEVLGQNRPAERRADLLNNAEGIKIADEVERIVQREKSLNPQMTETEEADLRERLLQQRVAEGVNSGRLYPNPKHDESWKAVINASYENEADRGRITPTSEQQNMLGRYGQSMHDFIFRK